METKETQTKVCPQCKTEIPIGAKKCPNCQSDLRNWAARHPLILLIIAVPFLVGILSGIVGDSQPAVATPTESSPAEIKSYAGIYAEMYVEQTLKSPSSAKFGDDSVTDLGKGEYSVSSYVDSQNSFGAML